MAVTYPFPFPIELWFYWLVGGWSVALPSQIEGWQELHWSSLAHLGWGSQDGQNPSCWHAVVRGFCSLIIKALSLESFWTSSTPLESVGVHSTHFFFEKIRHSGSGGIWNVCDFTSWSSSEKGTEHTINEVFRRENKNFLTYSWHYVFHHDIWSKKMYELSMLPIYFTHKPTADWWCAHKGYLFWAQLGNVSVPNASLYLPMGSV